MGVRKLPRQVAFGCLGAVLAVLLLMPLARSATKGNKKAEPIRIEADHMESDKAHNLVLFSGKVAAKQGEVLIHADEMTVYYLSAKAPKGEERRIDRLLAAGHVEITKGEWVAKGDKAEYTEAERKVVLTGNTKVWQNNSMVTGEKFIMYLDEGKSIVESGKHKQERVKAFFYPDSDK